MNIRITFSDFWLKLDYFEGFYHMQPVDLDIIGFQALPVLNFVAFIDWLFCTFNRKSFLNES